MAMSTAATIRIDAASSVLLHEQVAAAIRRAISEGEAGPGERLPPARDLAAVLGVNPNTVLRALRTLRDEGLLEFRRGRGVTVSGDAPGKNELMLKANEFVEIGRRLGYRSDELIQIVTNLVPTPR
jgi:DNA-binding transcriptional regulator YhcF (GntR family)